MRISPISTYSNMNFKGYDARRLKSIAITEVGAQCETARQLDEIARKNGFELEILNDDELRPLSYCFEERTKEQPKIPEGYVHISEIKPSKSFTIVLPEKTKPKKNVNGFKSSENAIKWAQDIATVTPNKNVLTNSTWYALGEGIAKKYDKKPIYSSYHHILGGNLFYIKNGLEENLLIGMDEKLRHKGQTARMKKFFGVNKIMYVPQMDYHLDLFIRPLDNKRVLVANDDMTIKMFETGIKTFIDAAMKAKNDYKELTQIDSIIEKLLLQKKCFSDAVKNNNDRPSYKEIAKTLTKKGFEPIPVPGRVYYHKGEDLVQTLNYMNAVVAVNDNDEMVYITNKSKLDEKFGITKEIEEKYGFSTEKYFKDAISEYIKPENIHFISGYANSIADDLERLAGGIHCKICEIPE